MSANEVLSSLLFFSAVFWSRFRCVYSSFSLFAVYVSSSKPFFSFVSLIIRGWVAKGNMQMLYWFFSAIHTHTQGAKGFRVWGENAEKETGNKKKKVCSAYLLPTRVYHILFMCCRSSSQQPASQPAPVYLNCLVPTFICLFTALFLLKSLYKYDWFKVLNPIISSTFPFIPNSRRQL
jgi:hypothetical protein